MNLSPLKLAAITATLLAFATLALTARSFQGDKWETTGPSSVAILLYSGSVQYESHDFSAAHVAALDNGYAHIADTRTDAEHDADIPETPWHHAPIPEHQFSPGWASLGFAYAPFTSTTRQGDTILIDRKFLIALPLWLPFLAFAAVPVYYIRHQKHQVRRQSRRQRRRQAKTPLAFCRSCNTTLDGIPYLCPHCGTPTTPQTALPTLPLTR